MIKVGIHENLYPCKVAKNDKGTLVLGVKAFAANVNPLAALDASSDDSATDSDETDFLFYPFQVTNKDNQLDTAENNQKKIKTLKDQLNHILLSYVTQDKIKWNTLDGTGITPENINEKMLNEGTLQKIYDNIADQFIVMITPFLTDQSVRRWIFVRQSKAKHFPALRKTFLADNPFIESMTVPAAQSRLKFTKWEKDNGFDNPNAVTSDLLTEAGGGGTDAAFSS